MIKIVVDVYLNVVAGIYPPTFSAAGGLGKEPRMLAKTVKPSHDLQLLLSVPFPTLQHLQFSFNPGLVDMDATKSISSPPCCILTGQHGIATRSLR